MSIHAKRSEEALERLHNQMVFMLSRFALKDDWVALSSVGQHQFVHKLGHTFTTVPRFSDDIHDKLTARFKKTLLRAGYDKKDVEQCHVMIDREAGDVTVNLVGNMHEDIQERMQAAHQRYLESIGRQLT